RGCPGGRGQLERPIAYAGARPARPGPPCRRGGNLQACACELRETAWQRELRSRPRPCRSCRSEAGPRQPSRSLCARQTGHDRPRASGADEEQTLTMAPGGQLRPTRLYHQPTFAAYLRAAAALASRSPERAQALAAEGFEIAQWAQHSQAAAAL